MHALRTSLLREEAFWEAASETLSWLELSAVVSSLLEAATLHLLLQLAL